MGDEMLHRNTILRELLEQARRVVEDGVISDEEATAFRDWVERHPDLVGLEPAEPLVRHLRRIFADGRLDPREREELFLLLQDLTGEQPDARPWEWGKLDRSADGEA